MDVKTCLSKFNKTKRRKLARYLSELSEQAQIVALHGITAVSKPRNDGGGLRILLVRDNERRPYQSVYPVALVLSECTTSGERCRTFPLPDPLPAQVAELLADFAPSLFSAAESSAQDAPVAAPEKPFSGWKGGRPRRVLSAAEKAQIEAARADGKTIDAIASDMHISNRVISSYLKMSK